jgi:uncharacterized membrane protein
MRTTLPIFILLSLLMATSGIASATSQQAEPPMVQAILFWSNGCSYCTQTISDTIPALQGKYLSQLSILMIEVVSLQDVDNLYAIATQLGYTKEQVAVPFLLINHTALIGADEIRDRSVDVIDENLSAGGADYPDLPLIREMLPKGVAFTDFALESQPVQQAASNSNTIGMALAWGIMVLMGLALVFSIIMIVRAFNGKPLGNIRRWLDLIIPVLSVIGLGASIYLTYVEITHTRALCGPVGDCNTVQSSPYAKLFGIIPIGLVGAVGYVAILIAWLWQHYRTDRLAQIAGPVMYAMALFGTLFSIYLTYLEIFVIHAVCLWCLSSAVIITLLLLLNLPPITQWLAVSDEEERAVE